MDRETRTILLKFPGDHSVLNDSLKYSPVAYPGFLKEMGVHSKILKLSHAILCQIWNSTNVILKISFVVKGWRLSYLNKPLQLLIIGTLIKFKSLLKGEKATCLWNIKRGCSIYSIFQFKYHNTFHRKLWKNWVILSCMLTLCRFIYDYIFSCLLSKLYKCQ
jgi:hypothetical protein